MFAFLFIHNKHRQNYAFHPKKTFSINYFLYFKYLVDLTPKPCKIFCLDKTNKTNHVA